MELKLDQCIKSSFDDHTVNHAENSLKLFYLPTFNTYGFMSYFDNITQRTRIGSNGQEPAPIHISDEQKINFIRCMKPSLLIDAHMFIKNMRANGYKNFAEFNEPNVNKTPPGSVWPKSVETATWKEHVKTLGIQENTNDC